MSKTAYFETGLKEWYERCAEGNGCPAQETVNMHIKWYFEIDKLVGQGILIKWMKTCKDAEKVAKKIYEDSGWFEKGTARKKKIYISIIQYRRILNKSFDERMKIEEKKEKKEDITDRLLALTFPTFCDEEPE